MKSVHSVAASGFLQGSHYDSNRPSYTNEAVKYVADVFQELSPLGSGESQCDILELGAGTGKFTEKILSQLSSDVKYVASEPSEPFLATLKSKVPDSVQCISCTARDIPFTNNSIKLIIAAQCFHWFADNENLQEIHRVLVPGGRFVCVWNNKDWSVPWIKAMEDVLTQYYDEDVPRAIKYKWKEVIERFTGFTLKRHQMLPGVHIQGDKDFIVGHFSSISVISKLPDHEKQEALNKFYTVLNSHEMTKNLTEIHVPLKTEIYDVEKAVS